MASKCSHQFVNRSTELQQAMCIYLPVYLLCQSKGRRLDLLQQVPVGLSVLDTSNSHLLLDLWQVLRLVGVEGSGRHDAVCSFMGAELIVVVGEAVVDRRLVRCVN